jgi:hypothetical protein
MSVAVDPAAVRLGVVRGRYFRENFAQGGVDLVQIVPELVTNADAAIARSGRERGGIALRFGPPDADLRRSWVRAMRRLGAPALTDWALEVSCLDDGDGVDAETVDRRLGALGALPVGEGQRGLFGRGLRDVWMAQGGGRIQGVRRGRAVETWFFPAAGDDPYAFVHVMDGRATPAVRRAFGIEGDGTRVTVPLAIRRLPSRGRLRTLVAQLVQLRPVLEDPARDLWLDLPGEPLQLVTPPLPEADPERPVLADRLVELLPGAEARIVVRRALSPIPPGPSRATRLGGLVVRSGRAAHESTLAGFDGHSGARHLYGEVRCEAIERLQREALDSPRPQVVVRVDRSGLNEHHPLVKALYEAIERVLRPIVAEEERRAGAHLMSAGRAIRARDAEGLRALNDALRTAFDTPGNAAFERGGAPSPRAAIDPGAPAAGPGGTPPPGPGAAPAGSPMRFKQSPIRLHPGERRSVSLLVDPGRIPPGTPIELVADPGLAVSLRADVVPPPGRLGWSRVGGAVRASVSVEPGAKLSALAAAGGHDAELDVRIVRHRAGGWVREIARKDEDAVVEAVFDPESGVVTVFEGRREFKALERAARRSGLRGVRAREFLPYRMLEVEVAANAVYAWAAQQILEARLPEERPTDPGDFAAALRLEAQALRHRFHERLMRAFLDPRLFERDADRTPAAVQGTLLDGDA